MLQHNFSLLLLVNLYRAGRVTNLLYFRVIHHPQMFAVTTGWLTTVHPHPPITNTWDKWYGTHCSFLNSAERKNVPLRQSRNVLLSWPDPFCKHLANGWSLLSLAYSIWYRPIRCYWFNCTYISEYIICCHVILWPVICISYYWSIIVADAPLSKLC